MCCRFPPGRCSVLFVVVLCCCNYVLHVCVVALYESIASVCFSVAVLQLCVAVLAVAVLCVAVLCVALLCVAVLCVAVLHVSVAAPSLVRIRFQLFANTPTNNQHLRVAI